MQRTVVPLAFCGVFFLVGSGDSLRAQEQPLHGAAAERVGRSAILVIAHRGDSKAAPENTLPAFASAVKAGADFVELDYYHSVDGVPIVCHDFYLDRTTNATALWGGTRLNLTAKTLTELKLLDAGSWFGPRFAGTRLPTLAEALDTIQAGSLTLVERKGGLPATCVDLLKEKGLIERVVVQSFDWGFLADCHQMAGDLTLAALGQKELSPAKLDRIAKTGARVVAWDERTTDASTIAAIHARGWKAWAWTVDKPDRIARLVEAKIDGIITNQPALTRATVEAISKSR
jgi:glycerophosphoryl diester phosphodiesterase